jgi:hypothetical protein
MAKTIPRGQQQGTLGQTLTNATVAYGQALIAAAAATAAEGAALMAYQINPSDGNAQAWANSVLALQSAQAAVDGAYAAWQAAEQAYAQAGGGDA